MPGEERRAEPRYKSLKGVRVYVADTGAEIDCIIRSLSPSGARVEFETAPHLTGQFDVYFTSECIRVPAELVWQDGARVGLKFLKPLSWLTNMKPGSAL